MKISIFIAFITFFISFQVFAQDQKEDAQFKIALEEEGGHVGGGTFDELDLRNYLQRLSEYLESEEGLNDFPEIKNYNDKNVTAHFSKLMRQSVIKVLRTKPNGFPDERDCVSEYEPKLFIYCLQETLPIKEKINIQKIYRMLFHEMLVKTNLEKIVKGTGKIYALKNFSQYPISSRLEGHYTETDWFPGRKDSYRRVSCGLDGDILHRLYDCREARGLGEIESGHKKGKWNPIHWDLVMRDLDGTEYWMAPNQVIYVASQNNWLSPEEAIQFCAQLKTFIEFPHVEPLTKKRLRNVLTYGLEDALSFREKGITGLWLTDSRNQTHKYYFYQYGHYGFSPESGRHLGTVCYFKK